MDRRTPATALLLALIPAGLSTAAPQDNTAPPPRHEVLVTATRLETPERKVGSSVTIITAEDLARTHKTSVLEAIESVLSISTLQNGGTGASASVMIRGAASEHTLVLLDGIELNDPINPARSYDLAHLSLSQVERVEILRGPQGLLYGSNALGGVINIITRAGRGKPRLAMAASAGTLQTISWEAGLSGSGRNTDYSVAVSRQDTAGLSAASSAYPGNVEADGYRNLTLAGRFGHGLGPTSRLTLAVRAIDARTELDNFGGPGGDDPNSSQDYASLFIHAQYRSLSSGGGWEQALSVAWVGARRENENPEDDAHPGESEEASYRSDLLKLDWQNNFRLSSVHTLTAGFEAEGEKGRSLYVSQTSWGTFESSFPTARASSAGAYLLDHWESRRGFFVTGGVRADLHSQAGSAVTFRLAPAYLVPGTGTKLKATLGTGFKAPSLYQLYAPATAWGPVGNSALRPERVTGWDAGVEQSFLNSRLVLGLTYFESAFQDLIDFDYVSGYVNIGRARTKGLEASAEARPSGGVRLRAFYTGLSARDEDAGTELLRRPRDKFSADAAARLFGRIDLTVTALFVGSRLDRDFSTFPASTVELPGYALLGAALSAPLSGRLELFVRLDNILGVSYEQVWGYGAPGFYAVAGIRLAN
jgi:vitamin B12 transporter